MNTAPSQASVQSGPGAGDSYLHLVRDEKFIDAAFSTFNAETPGSHRFAIIDSPGRLIHIRSFEPGRISLIEAMSTDFLSTLPLYIAVFLHGLSPVARWIVSHAPATTRFVWLGWGGDYYHLIRHQDDLLLPVTRSLMTDLHHERHRKRWFRRMNIARNVLRKPRSWHTFVAKLRLDRAMRRIGPDKPGEESLLGRISLFAPALLEEYALIKATHPKFAPDSVSWNYGINATLVHASRAHAPALGNDIMLGNSATPENNHADALALLGAPRGRAVVCPLSYGDAGYAALVSGLGRSTLGKVFRPLHGFVAPLEYADLMRSCGIVVMNHLRQQGMGTVNAALCNGAKVFLRPENPLYAFYSKLGVRVFSIDELPAHLSSGAKPLDDVEVAHARSVIDAQFGTAALQHKTRKLLQACDALRTQAI